MALATATITYDLADQGGVDFDARRTKVWATTNLRDETVIDTAGNQIRLGSANGTVNADGTGSISVWTPGTGSNPASWQTYIHVDYPDRHAQGGRKRRTFGPFTITASADLADLVAEMEVPAEYLTVVTADLNAIRDDAATSASNAASSASAAASSAALAHDISGISTSDGVVDALLADPASDTSVRLKATYAGLSGDNTFDGIQTFEGGTTAGAVIALKPTSEDGYCQIYFHPEQGVIQDVGITVHRESLGTETLHQHMTFYTSPAIGEAPVSRMNIQYGVADAKIDFSRSHLDFDISAAPGAGGGYFSRVVLGNTAPVQAWNSEGTSMANLLSLNASEEMEIGGTNIITAMVFYPGASEKMRLTTSGKLGIGTNNPQDMVHAEGTDAAVRLKDTGSGWKLRTYGGDASMYDLSTGDHRVYFAAGGSVHFHGTPGASKAFVSAAGELEVTTASNGVILKSPDGTRYRVTVANGGTIAVAAA